VNRFTLEGGMETRLGDIIDDFCVKCKRIMNHAVVSILDAKPAKVRCRTCYNDHDYRHEQPPPPKIDPRKAALLEAKAAAALQAQAAAGVPAEIADDVQLEITESIMVESLAIPELDAAPVDPEPAPVKAKAKARGRK
jgi:hypothetical protein